MSDHGHAPDRSAQPSRGSSLSIAYTPDRKGQKRRQVVYIRHGNPPITDAEVEIMRLHLDGENGNPNHFESHNDNF